MIITDGQSTGGMATIRDPIKKLKDDSVNIISIGVGRGTNANELKFMASSPSSTHVFSVQNMEQLRNLIGSITSSSCSSEFFSHVPSLFTCGHDSFEVVDLSGL